jgi:hypothetical protein
MVAVGGTARSKAVIFDYSTLLVDDEDTLECLRGLLDNLRALGVRIVSFSTHARHMNREMERRRLPPLDLFLTSADVGARKGSPTWITAAAESLGIEPCQTCYVGDDDLDWKTAINAGVMFLHANWSKAKQEKVTAFGISTPESLFRFLTHFFLPPARWQYTLDSASHGLCIRSLLNATTVLAADEPDRRFTLQDIFTYDNKRKVGGAKARDLLMIHAIANLYAEGLICSGCRFAIYPSSQPGKRKPTFTEFLEPAAKLFHGWLVEDLLVRAAPAPDTSKLRTQGRGNEVKFLIQANTVIVNPDYQGKLDGKTVIVYDDFTTSGMSLDWARTVLRAAGVPRVVLVTFGKYGKNHPLKHCCYVARGRINPYELAKYQDAHFNCISMDTELHDDGRAMTVEMFRLWQQRQPYGL